MDIGIRTLNPCSVRSIKRGVGLKNEEIHFAWAIITPQDYIYVDMDGILVSEKWLLGK